MTLALVSQPHYNRVESSFPAESAAPWLLRREHTRMVITVADARANDGIRPIDMARDVPQIIDLLKLVFGEALELDDQQLLGDEVGASLSSLFYRLNPATSRLANGFVWLAEGRIVGNVTLLPTKTWDRYLVANVAVHPNYRRRGIARAMMHAVTSAVKTRGGRAILLQVVKDNDPAIDLYRSLGYVGLGHVSTWYSATSRLRRPDPPAGPPAPDIRPLPSGRWRDAYALDTAAMAADLNWPEPLRPDAYRQTWWQRLSDVMNSRLFETWAITDSRDHLLGVTTIAGQWGRPYLVTLRVHPDHAGQLERPLLAKVVRRLQNLPRRNVRVDHSDNDTVANALLAEANFAVQRTLTHMRLDLSR